MDLKQYFYESADVKKNFIDNVDNQITLEKIIQALITCFEWWNKVLIAWNGWSAADTQHFTTELMGRYKKERDPLPAIALTTDTSFITAVANDYDFDVIFARQIKWLGKPWDVFIAISTSGNSKNLIKTIEKCREKGIITISLLGKGWGEMKWKFDYELIVPSDNTPRIQECQETIFHTICEEIDNHFPATWK